MLVIGGAGYVGRAVAAALRAGGVEVMTTSRTAGRADVTVASGADLDALLAERAFAQVVHLPQLTSIDGGELLDRVDGPRWLVFSSAQLDSSVPPPGDDLARAHEVHALARGAAVLRPTMIFGRGGDVNVSRLIRLLRRYRVPVVVGDGSQLVQPVHVDDVSSLVTAHGRRPVAGLFPVGGDEQLPVGELVDRLRRSLGLRVGPVRIRSRWLRTIARLPLPGLRPDQVLRLLEDKVVDTSATRDGFGWAPLPLAQRLDEAIEAVVGPGQGREMTST